MCSAAPEAAKEPPTPIRISIEPTFAALGPSHAALGMNNIVYFHALDQPGCPLVSEREYLGTVEAVALNNEHCAVLTEGRVQLHTIGDAGGSHMFPQQHDERGMTCFALTKEFLVLGASSGEVTYFYLPEQCQVRLT